MHRIPLFQRKRQILLSLLFCALTLGPLCAREALAAPPTSDTADLNFSVSEDCVGHAHFMQAAAREDGAFIIYSRGTVSAEDHAHTLKQVYIDIYDSKGIFLRELAFSSPFDLAVELTENHVYVYLPSTLLSYHLQSGELKSEDLSAHAADRNKLYSALRAETFSCGEWEYQCLKKYGENVGLIRRNGAQEQLLVEFPGSTRPFWKTWPPMILLCTGIILLPAIVSKRKKKKS